MSAAAVLFALSAVFHSLLALALLVCVGFVLAFGLDVALGPRDRDIRVIRKLPDHFVLGAAATIVYEIENHSSRAVRIGVVESPTRTLDDNGDSTVATSAPNTKVVIERSMVPIARGRDRLGALYVWYENSIGLLRRRLKIPADEAIRVYPDLSAVERYGSLRLRNRLIEAGLRRMRLRGIGTEFESLRAYSEGDAFRSIDWKATARRGKLMVAAREVERSQDIVILLDCGRLMTARIDERRKLDYAVTAALSLASIASLASDRVGFVAFAREILAARAPRSTAASIRALSDAICDIEPRFEESDYAHAFAFARSHLHRRSLIVFLTDAIDPVARGPVLAELRSLAKHHVVLCAFISDGAVADALAHAPLSIAGAYKAGVALGLRRERASATATLERLGIGAIDVPARSLSTATIDAYLRIKQRGLH